MIYSYERGSQPLLKYSTEVSFLDNKVEFEKGINIVVGVNGSGKSTLINSLAKLFFCYQQGYSKINGLGDISGMTEGLFNPSGHKVNFSDIVKSNGFPMLYNNRYETGYFDDDNFNDSFESIFTQNNSSSGEIQKYEYDKLLQNFERLKPLGKMVKDFKEGVNDYYKELADSWYDWVKENKESTKDDIVTILLDEPTANFDIVSKFEFWNNMKDTMNEHFQIIVATHDITPFLIKGFEYNIIETEKDYYKKIKELI